MRVLDKIPALGNVIGSLMTAAMDQKRADVEAMRQDFRGCLTAVARPLLASTITRSIKAFQYDHQLKRNIRYYPTAFHQDQTDLSNSIKEQITSYVLANPWIYLLYWTYKNWKTYRATTNAKILPLMRTLFGLFFIYPLLMKIDHQLKTQNKKYKWSPRLLASRLIISGCIAIYCFLPLEGLGDGYLLPITNLLLDSYCLLQVQSAINHLSDDPQGQQNANLTIANYAWVSSMWLGVLLWAVIEITICGPYNRYRFDSPTRWIFCNMSAVDIFKAATKSLAQKYSS